MSYSKAQTWAALKKAWKGYKIAKAKSDKPGMLKYAERIRALQDQLGLERARFPDLGLN
jgi:hypothetical protein